MALIWDLQCFGHHCSNHLMGKSWDPLQSVLANVAGWENSEVSGVEVFGKYLANCGIFQPCQGYVGMAIDPNLTQWYTLKKVVFPMKIITPSLRWRRIQESVAIISLSCLQRTWRFFKKTELWVMESAGAEPRVEMIWVSQMLTHKWCCPSACNSGPVSVFLAYHFCSQSSSESSFDIIWSSLIYDMDWYGIVLYCCLLIPVDCPSNVAGHICEEPRFEGYKTLVLDLDETLVSQAELAASWQLLACDILGPSNACFFLGGTQFWEPLAHWRAFGDASP